MKKYVPIILISLLAIALRVAWSIHTDYTAEDAHISFQFARRIVEGNGFALNPNEPIYGTTTPLLTLLLAFWLFFAPDPVLASKLIGLVSVVGGLWFLYFALPYRKAAIIATLVLAVSLKLISEEMAGMETPLLFLFMAGAYYGYTKDRPYLSGIMCGLLLWTRIDSVVFVACLFLANTFLWNSLFFRWRSFVQFTIGTFVYAPWLAFAWLYFGSPVPYTITAKAVAYGLASLPIAVHFLRMIDYISWPVFLLTIVSVLYVGKRNLFMALFFTANFLVLAKSGATFFDRYFYTITVISIVMCSLMASRVKGEFWKAVIILALVYGSSNWQSYVGRYKYTQTMRNDVLQDIGLWFNENTPEGSVILLEPLGYIGYYADRVMADEVGLVTPRVVALHKAGVRGHEFYLYLWPDYVLLQCTQPMGDIGEYYERVRMFDNGYPRACYDVWEIK